MSSEGVSLIGAVDQGTGSSRVLVGTQIINTIDDDKRDADSFVGFQRRV